MNLSVSLGNLRERWDWSESPLNFSESGWQGRILSSDENVVFNIFSLGAPL